MGETYTEIPEYLIQWILKQHMFWVASAPLSASGHVNISPKGVEGTFHIDSPTRVWYEDLSGSGAETIAHIRENGRVTVLFNAFEGPPRIARLYGKGSFHELGSPEYDALLPLGTRQPGSRAVIIIDVYKVGTTCGYSVPYYSFLSHRTPLLDWAAKKEATDLLSLTQPSSESGTSFTEPSVTPHPNGLLSWWETRNTVSLDGLLALSSAFKQPPSSLGTFKEIARPAPPASTKKLDHFPPTSPPSKFEYPQMCNLGVTEKRWSIFGYLVSFLLGALVTTFQTEIWVLGRACSLVVGKRTLG